MGDNAARKHELARIQQLIDGGASDEEIAEQFKAIEQESAQAASSSTEPRTEPGEEGTPRDYAKALVGGAIDTVSLGALSPESDLASAEKFDREARAAARAGSPLSPHWEDRVKGGYENAQRNAYATSRNPYTSALGMLLGAPLGLGTKVGSVALRALGPVSKGGKILHAAGAAGLGGGTETTGRALVAGESLPEALKQGATAALPSAALGGLGRYANVRLRDPKKLTGEYVKAKEWGRESGYYDSPEYKGPKLFDDPAEVPVGTPEGLRGVAVEARRLGGELATDNAGRYKQLNRAWEEGMEHPSRNTLTDVSDFMGDLNESVVRFSNKRPLDKGVASAVEDARLNLGRDVEAFQPAPGSPVGPGEAMVPYRRPPKSGPVRTLEGQSYDPPSAMAARTKVIEMESAGSEFKPVATLDDLIKQKQQWKEMAEHGTPATKDNRPYRKMYSAAVKATKRLADEHPDPAIREAAGKQLAADEAFLIGAQELEDINSRLFGKEKASLNNSVAAQRRAGNELLQVLKDTQASGSRFEDFQALRAMGGKSAEVVNKAGAKMADEATKFSIEPRTFSHSGNWLMGPLTQMSQATNVRLLEPFTRKLAPQAAVQAGRMVPHFNRDILDAILARKKAEEEARMRLEEPGQEGNR